MFERPSSFNLEEFGIYAGSVSVQIGYGLLNVLMSIQLSGGMKPLPLVVYTNALAVLALSPFAFFMEKKKRPTMSMSIFYQILLLSIGGVSAFDALTLIGLRDTSSALASAMPNLAPAIIFIMAWILGMEKVDIMCKYSRSKIVGTVVSVCGAMAMSFLQGPSLSQLWPHPHGHGRHEHRPPLLIIKSLLQDAVNPNKYWIAGSIYLAAASVILCSAMILQVETLKKYPAVLSLTAMTCLLGSIETAVLQIALDRGIKEASWKVDWSGFGTMLYAGVIGCGLSLSVQAWCLQRKGPVFVAIFNPICTVCAAILSSIFLRETFHLGSAIGVLLIFTGLYFVLWGKSKDGIIDACKMTCDEEQLMNGDVLGRLHCNHIADINKPLLQ